MHDEFTLSFESCFVEIVNLISSKEEDENKKKYENNDNYNVDRQVVLEDTLKTSSCIYTMLLLSPLRKECASSFEKMLLSFTKQCIVYLVEIVPVVLEEKIEI